MLNFFRKKKKDEGPHYDPTNITVHDLRKGFFFDYDLRTWEVIDEFEYDWGNNIFSYEFKVRSGNDTVYMRIENDEEVYLIFTNKILKSHLDDTVWGHFQRYNEGPSRIEYDGETYYREGEYPGFCRNTEDPDSVEIILWNYLDKDGENVLVVYQWNDQNYDVSVGWIDTDRAISNILPRG
jgi:hypothetical protein